MNKTIRLSGRIDTTNAQHTESALMQEIGDFAGELILDADELDYISSSGLRVILRLRKKYTNIKIINCKPDVYEIFEMTGFTDMIDISKAYRRVDITGCEVIGEGFNGIVYRLDPETIVKVYKHPDCLPEIHAERELARKAFVMGVPTAIPYDVVRVGECYGSVFELLNAKSFAMLLREGFDLDTLAKESVDILKIIHSTQLKHGELPDKKQEGIKWARVCLPHLPEGIGDRLVELFSAIPDSDCMIHGDFHVKNIMRQNDENLLIDMDTLAVGNPVFEFEAIYAAYLGFSCVDSSASAVFLGIDFDHCHGFWNKTVEYYFAGKSKEYIQDAVRKISIVSYTRMLRRFITRLNMEDPGNKLMAEYCKQYITKNLPLVDSLAI